jgi:hypothetical protein
MACGMVGRVIDKLLRHLLPNSDTHLSDERLAALFCGELSLFERWTARRHLAMCRECRMRQRSLEGPRAEYMIQLYRESLEGVDTILQEEPREAFATWLQFQVRRETSQQRWTVPASAAWKHSLLSALPSASIGVAIGLITGALVFSFLGQERIPSISANALLVRAESWDTPNTAANPGVAHQTIQIKTAKQTVNRSIYWDVQGRHRPKPATLSVAEEQLRSTLGAAGVDWNQPISASAYQAWHDHQHVRADRIDRSGVHLLTLTTTVPDGEVSEESLTVRDTDFHPIARRVDFRDSEIVEIAEVDFTILPWSSVGPSVFEPVGGVGDPKMIGSQLQPLLLPLPRRPLAPTPEQLDETELTVRLILNQLAADTGEQIEIHRLPQAIEVDGLVETEERKRQLESQLGSVPRLKLVLQSAAQMREAPLTGSESVSVQATSLPDRSSALETYLRSRGRKVDDINAMAQQAFTAALAISHESSAMVDLKTRFVATEQMPVIASATVVELLYSHHARLETALRQERGLLAQMEGGSSFNGRILARGSASLSEEASRNLVFVKELTQTDAPAERNAEAIFADMSSTLDRIAGAADQAYGESAKDSRRNTDR